MSEEKSSTDLKLNGLFTFKEGMATVYGASGESIPVTVLRYEPCVVTQIKTKESDGYEAVQVGIQKRRATRATKAGKAHFTKAGFENGAQYAREVRQKLPEGVAIGQSVSLDSVAVGDKVRLTGVSKGKGFAGVVKRYKFAGGRASHGRGFLRQPGSVGNRTWPGRVMPGKRFPGHMGAETVTTRNVEIVDIIKDQNLVLVKGAVPGGRNTLIKIEKVK